MLLQNIAIVLLVDLHLIWGSVITGNFRVHIHNATVTSDADYFVVKIIELRNQVEPNQIDVHVEVKNVSVPIYAQMSMAMVLSNGDLQRFVNGKPVELCGFFKNKKKSDIFLRIFFSMINDFGNQLNKCPIQPMKFDIRNMALTNKYFPSFMPTGTYKLTIPFTRLADGKRHIPVCTYSFFAEIVRSAV